MFTTEQFYAEIKPNDEFGYSLTNVKEFKLSGGVAWVGTICHNNKKVGEVESRGDGGCYNYSFADVVDRADFDDAVKEAYAGRVMFDVEEDCFINWLDYLQQGGK